MPSANWSIDFSQPSLILAPMEGVVDAVNRELISSLGATDLCVTEFIRVVDTLLPERLFRQYCPELATGSKTLSGTPVHVQLLGSNATAMAENAARAIELGTLGVDLNFGCPAKTVNRNDGGAALLKTPERIFKIIETVRRAVPAHFPVSAKIRLGFDDKSQALELAQAAASGGAAWLAVHARTKTDGYRPPAYWEYIAPLTQALSIPVISNGEVWTVADYHRCREVSGSAHVMIGRGWVANPGLGMEIRAGAERRSWMAWQNYFLKFVELSVQLRHESYAIQRTKQLAKIMSQSYGEALVLLENIKRLQELAPMLEVLRFQFTDPTLPVPEPRKIVIGSQSHLQTHSQSPFVIHRSTRQGS